MGPAVPMDSVMGEVLTPNPNVVKIPLRVGPGVPYTELEQEDIILGNGDIIFIESRDAEVFYTGGLIPGGQHEIPAGLRLGYSGGNRHGRRLDRNGAGQLVEKAAFSEVAVAAASAGSFLLRASW